MQCKRIVVPLCQTYLRLTLAEIQPEGSIGSSSSGVYALKERVLESLMSFMETYDKHCYIKLQSASSFKRGASLQKNKKNITNVTNIDVPKCNYGRLNTDYHKFENVMYLLENGANNNNGWQKSTSSIDNGSFAALTRKVKQPIFNYKKFKDYYQNYVANYLANDIPSLKQQAFWKISVLNKFLINNGWGFVDSAGGSLHTMIGIDLFSVITADFDFKIYVAGQTQEIRENREYVIKQWVVDSSSAMNYALNASDFFDVLLNGQIFSGDAEFNEIVEINETALEYVCDTNIHKSFDNFVRGKKGKGVSFTSRGSESFFVPLYSKDFNLMTNYIYRAATEMIETTNQFTVSYFDLVFKNLYDNYLIFDEMNKERSQSSQSSSQSLQSLQSSQSSSQQLSQSSQDTVTIQMAINLFATIDVHPYIGKKINCEILLQIDINVSTTASSITILNPIGNMPIEMQRAILVFVPFNNGSGGGDFKINPEITCFYLLRIPTLNEIKMEIDDLINIPENNIGRILTGKKGKDKQRSENIRKFVDIKNADKTTIIPIPIKNMKFDTTNEKMLRCYYQINESDRPDPKSFNCSSGGADRTGLFGKIKEILNSINTNMMMVQPGSNQYYYYNLNTFLTNFYWACIMLDSKYVEFKYNYHINCALNNAVVTADLMRSERGRVDNATIEMKYNELCQKTNQKMCAKLRIPVEKCSRNAMEQRMIEIVDNDFRGKFNNFSIADNVRASFQYITRKFNDMIEMRKAIILRQTNQSNQSNQSPKGGRNKSNRKSKRNKSKRHANVRTRKNKN